MSTRGVLMMALAVATLSWAQAPRLRVWRQEALRMQADPLAGDAPLAVGSLQKPFVVRAWAASHPGQEPPRYTCTAASGCWHKEGHGTVDLVQAISLSCNPYFLSLAAQSRPERLREAFSREGFQGTPGSPEASIGLPSATPLTIRPSRLLEAYARLLREPWPEGEPLRKHVLAGLRAAAQTGTAKALGQPCWAKTGTVPIGDGTRTRGLVWMEDESAHGTLAELEPGTGREAAAVLGDRMRRSPLGGTISTEAQERRVVVRLFDLMGRQTWRVRNLGGIPLPSAEGFLGPGGSQELKNEGWVGPGLVEVEIVGTGLVRRVEGRIAVLRDRQGRRYLAASLTPREYVAGVLAAEIGRTEGERRLALGATVLRFLAQGSRHGEADVCDSTHCAWFIGRGPWLVWTTPQRAIQPTQGATDTPRAITDAEWRAMEERAERPGPHLWSGSCGGAPLSAHAVWGTGDRAVLPCPRHPTGSQPPWQRTWSHSAATRAFGGMVKELKISHPDGIWTLTVVSDRGSRDYRFDEAHRALASVLGWDALPSPADRVTPTAEGFLASGVGRGHRVGMCLGE